ITTETAQGTVRPHQPGHAVFRALLSEEVDWKHFAAFPPTARLAVLVGQPSEPGPYVIRVKVPRGVKLMPHTHPEDRIYTVISGIFYSGLGGEFDADKLEAYPPAARRLRAVTGSAGGRLDRFHGRRPADENGAKVS